MYVFLMCFSLCPLKYFRLTRASTDLCTEYLMRCVIEPVQMLDANVRQAHIYSSAIPRSHKVRGWWFVFHIHKSAHFSHKGVFVNSPQQVHFSWNAWTAKNRFRTFICKNYSANKRYFLSSILGNLIAFFAFSLFGMVFSFSFFILLVVALRHWPFSFIFVQIHLCGELHISTNSQTHTFQLHFFSLGIV